MNYLYFRITFCVTIIWAPSGQSHLILYLRYAFWRNSVTWVSRNAKIDKRGFIQIMEIPKIPLTKIYVSNFCSKHAFLGLFCNLYCVGCWKLSKIIKILSNLTKIMLKQIFWCFGKHFKFSKAHIFLPQTDFCATHEQRMSFLFSPSSDGNLRIFEEMEGVCGGKWPTGGQADIRFQRNYFFALLWPPTSFGVKNILITASEIYTIRCF